MAANIRLARAYVLIAPMVPAKVIMADWKGLRSKSICNIDGIRNGMAPVETRKIVPLMEAAWNVGFLKNLKSSTGAGWCSV